MVKCGEIPDRGRSWLTLYILVLAVILLSGCDKITQLVQQPQIVKKQQERITSLAETIHRLELQLAGVQQALKSEHINVDERFATLDSSLNSLGTKYAVLDSDVNKHKKCIFESSAKGVQRLDTDFGSLFVSLDGITAYHNSSKVNLNIGNPSLSEISEFTLHLSYGKAFNPSGSESYDIWLNSLKSINKPFKEHLKPGQWNKIELPLENLKPEEIKYITVQMTVDNIILKQQQALR